MLLALGENVGGGILAGLVFPLCAWLRSKLKGRLFKQVFGKRVAKDGMTLVYEELVLPSTTDTHPYSKPGAEGKQPFFSISRPISIASVRAVSYLASAIGKSSGKTPSVRSDLETKSLMDLTLSASGGLPPTS
ncbi:MAG: hypothetical protein WA185_06715 [Candidatus Acidiferrales bacterium]